MKPISNSDTCYTLKTTIAVQIQDTKQKIKWNRQFNGNGPNPFLNPWSPYKNRAFLDHQVRDPLVQLWKQRVCLPAKGKGWISIDTKLYLDTTYIVQYVGRLRQGREVCCQLDIFIFLREWKFVSVMTDSTRITPHSWGCYLWYAPYRILRGNLGARWRGEKRREQTMHGVQHGLFLIDLKVRRCEHKQWVDIWHRDYKTNLRSPP